MRFEEGKGDTRGTSAKSHAGCMCRAALARAGGVVRLDMPGMPKASCLAARVEEEQRWRRDPSKAAHRGCPPRFLLALGEKWRRHGREELVR